MKKLIFGLLLFIGLFSLIAVGTTYICILKVNEMPSGVLVNEPISDSKESDIDLNGVYAQNDLLIKEVTENYKDIEIKVPYIEGLKNIKIQTQINNEIRTLIYRELEKVGNVSDTYYGVDANFSNVISISYYISSPDSMWSNKIAFNYNLVTGEKLKLEDLFVRDVDLASIVKTAFYNEMISRQYDVESTNALEVEEDKLYKAVKHYLGGSDKFFTFSPANIYFSYDDNSATIKMKDIAQDVVIYTKYLTDKSIYEKSDIGRKNLFTCSDINHDFFERIEYGYLEDNYWYDFTMWKEYSGDTEPKKEQFSLFKEKKSDEMYERVNEYREKARNNPDKFYILLVKPRVYRCDISEYENGEWNNAYSDMASVYEDIKVFEMPIGVYQSEYKEKIREAYRANYFEMNGGVFLWVNEEDEVTVTESSNEKLYNFVTGEELTSLVDIFNEDSGYMDVIKAEVKAWLMRMNYSEEEAGLILNETTYSIDGGSVKATILDGATLNIYFNKFDKEMFKLISL